LSALGGAIAVIQHLQYMQHSQHLQEPVMQNPTYTTSDFSKKSGDIIADALRQPVTITQRNKPRLIVLNIEDYARLRRQADPRRAGRTEDMSDELFSEVEKAIEEYAKAVEPAE
jgi:prevent-host-death family protein